MGDAILQKVPFPGSTTSIDSKQSYSVIQSFCRSDRPNTLQPSYLMDTSYLPYHFSMCLNLFSY